MDVSDPRRTTKNHRAIERSLIDTRLFLSYNTQMNIQKETVATIKLVTGEEVIARVSNIEGTTITIERPLVIMMSPQGLAFGTFVPTMDYSKGIDIDTRNIVVMGPAMDKVVTEYKNATSPIKTPPKSSLIV